MRARRGIAWLAGISLLLMLAVLGASAQIRAGPGLEALAALRAAHRLCASTVALLVTALAVLAWRAPGLRAAGVATFVLMLALSAVGWAAGTAPPPAAAFFNQFGGLALAALLALLWTRARAGAVDPGPLAAAALLFVLAQAAFGSALAAFAPAASPLVVVLRAAAGLAASAVVAALRTGPALACALLAPAAGLAAALPGTAAIAPTLHALSAALLLAAAGAAQGRRTTLAATHT